MEKFFENIIKWFEETFKPISDFFYTYRENPLLWICLLLIGLLISKLTYDALNKNNGL